MVKIYRIFINTLIVLIIAMGMQNTYADGCKENPAVHFEGCSGSSTEALQGSFYNGYNYNFETIGSNVTITCTLLDNKTGVEARLWQQNPFTESGLMTNTSGLTFTATLTGQTQGVTINYAVKFAYSGGMSVTKYISYVVGDNCSVGPTDTQAPTSFTVTAGAVTSSSVELLLNGTDDSGAVIYTITYGSTTTTVTGTSAVQKSVVISNLSPSTAYTFSVTAKDAANNVAANNPLSIAATTLADTNTACAGTSAQAQDGSFSTGYTYNFTTSGTSVTATFTMLDTDKTGVVAYLWTLAPNFAESPQVQGNPGLTFTRTVTGLTPGATISLAMKFAYAGGAVVTKWFTYTVGDACGVVPTDTQAPTSFTATAGAVTSSSVELLLNGTDDSGAVIYTITYGSTTTMATGTSGVQKSVVISNLSPSTAYAFSVTAKDAANNVAANNPLSIAATTLADTNTACAGTSAQAQDGSFSTGYTYNFTTSGTSVTATFTMLDTDKTGVVAYLWTLAPNFAESPQVQGNPGLTFTRTVTGLTPGATISLAMKFAYAGGAVVTKWFTYTVGDACGVVPTDTQAPTSFTATAGAVTSSSVELLLNGTDDSGIVFYDISYGSAFLSVTGVSGVQKSVVINNLTPEMAYSFSVAASDVAGNEAANNDIVIEVTTLVDTNTACTGTSSEAHEGSFSTGYSYNFQTNGGNVTATFTMLDTDKSGVVAYLWQVAPGFAEWPMAASGLTFTKTVEGLNPGAIVSFAVKFAYAGGQVVTKYFSYEVGDNCDGIEDTEAPESFTASVGVVTSTSVELLLNATDNSGEVNYDIMYGPTTISVTGESGVQKSAVISNLIPNTAYSFSIQASDENGNEAANNDIVVTVTTPENINTQCSGISTQALDGSFSTGYNYSFSTSNTEVTATFTLLDTDKTGVIAYLWLQDPFTEMPMNNTSGLTFSKTITGFAQGTTVNFAVKFAYAGGQSVTQYFTYLVGDNCDGTPLSFTTTWNGTSWSNGIPVSNLYNAVIEGDYNSATDGSITAGSLTVNSGDVVIAAGDNFTIKGVLTVNDEQSSFTIENNANLIQIDNVENTGNIKVQKLSAPMYRLDYAMWASPLSGETLKGFSPQTLNNRFYTYNSLTDAYNSVADPVNTEFAKGRGYLIRVANNHPDYVNDETLPERWAGTFTGEPNNGDIDIAVIPADVDEDVSGFNAIGNPYPSAINIAAFFAENENNLANNTPIFFWRKKNEAGTSSYCSLTLAGYNANSGNDFGDSSYGAFANANESENWVINPGQGFIVRAVNSTVSFRNSMRVGINNDQMFRNAQENPKSRLWINITSMEGDFGQATIAYTPNTTLGLDYGWDGRAITDGRIAIYSLAGESKLGIQARPEFDPADVVPLECKITTPGAYSVSLDHMDGVFSEGQDIYLRDNLLGITHDLKESPYNFTAEAGIVNGRFDVVYAQALGTNVPDFNSNSVVVYQHDNAINISSGSTNMKAVYVYDIQGRLLYQADGINTTEISVTTLQAESQMLIVQVETLQGVKISRKIVF